MRTSSSKLERLTIGEASDIRTFSERAARPLSPRTTIKRPLQDTPWEDVDWSMSDSAIAESLNLGLKAVESGRRRMQAARTRASGHMEAPSGAH